MATLALDFGALAPGIGAQLKHAGVQARVRDTRGWQKSADAVVLLYVRGLISDAAVDAARRRLMRRIVRTLEGQFALKN